MPRNAQGQYFLPDGNPVVPGELIKAEWANTTLDDVATALTNSLDRAGAGGMIGQFKSVSGTSDRPGIVFSENVTTGIFYPTTNSLGISTNAIERVRIDASGSVGIGVSGLPSGYSLCANTPIFANYQATNITPTIAAWEGQFTARGSAYQGGIALDATGLWLGHNSASRAICFANGDGTDIVERMRIAPSGDIGFGTTPKAQNAGIMLQVAGVTNVIGTSTTSYFSNNAVYNSGWKYMSALPATQYTQINGTHRWYYAPTGAAGNSVSFTAGMTLDASGFLGVGVTPSGVGYSLETANGASFGGNTQVSAGYFRMLNGGSAAIPSIQPGNDNNTGMYWIGSDNIGFSTGGSLAIQITDQGRILSYANTSSYTTQFDNANANPLGTRQHYSGAAPNGTGNVFFIATDTAGTKFTVRSNGGIANYSANNVNISDRREKQDFEPAGDYLDKLCQIPVQKFRYINQPLDDNDMSIGVIAQDVQAICPELVTEADWSNGDENQEVKVRLSIYQTDLEYAMLRAIQELKAEVDKLKAASNN